uniref:Lipase_3 domain-containing protein n=1 Tax=Steinernema glaseri TaxID=37863 RepID=A0A1I8A9F9_9BILA
MIWLFLRPTVLPFLLLIALVSANNFGPPCLPERRNFKLFYPCLEGPQEINYLNHRRFYNRLFYDLNSIPKGTRVAHIPNYGFNPNLPKDGPYAH